MPYGWQFKDEDVCIEAATGSRLNCFGLISRTNEFIFKTTEQTITASFIFEQLDLLSWDIKKQTIVVLDNAKIHCAKAIKEAMKVWQSRGLYIFYLPPYSPNLNIIERVWKEMKARWICPSDYQTKDSLFFQINLILNDIGKSLKINFKPFKEYVD